MKIFKITLSVVFLFSVLNLRGQGTEVLFGKNRVQHHEFDWMEYESPNFIAYWYAGGRTLGQAAIQIAEMDFEEIQNLMEHRINKKIQLIIYNDLTDLKQSNIGSEETFVNTGGQTKIVGNKVFVYFDGNHTNFRKQVREGIARVYMNTMMFGSNLQEIVQNAVLLNLPEWFTEGLVAYIGEEWNTDLDDQLRDAFLNERYEDFEDFVDANPRLAGQSMWYFISQNYGKATVSNLLYLTRINRSVENGFLYVLGTTYYRTTETWYSFYEKKYKNEKLNGQLPSKNKIEIKNKRKLPLSQFKISPDGKRFAYVSNEIGKFKVYVQDLETGKRKLILKGGHRNPFQATDYNYPLLEWNPNNQELAIIYEKRDVIQFLLYNTETGEPFEDVLAPQYQRIFSMDYLNAKDLIFSAMVNGYSDIFKYRTTNRQTSRITNDFWDDLDATVVKIDGKNGILFSSNRQDSVLTKMRLDTILPIQTFDIYYHSLEPDNDELVRVTNTPTANERNPMLLDSTYFAYLSDDSGIYNRYTGYLKDYIAYYEKYIYLKDGEEIILHQDSTLNIDKKLIDSTITKPVIKKYALTFPNTSYNRNIIEFNTSPLSQKIGEAVYNNGIYEYYFDDIDRNQKKFPLNTSYMQQIVKTYITEQRIQEEQAQIKAVEKELKEQNKIEFVTEFPEDKIAARELEDTTQLNMNYDFFQSDFKEDLLKKKKVEKKIVEKEIITDEGEKETVVESLIVKTSPSLNAIEEIEGIHKFRQSRVTPSRLKFRTNHITTQLDNGLLFGGLDSYAGNRFTNSGINNRLTTPPPGIFLKGSVEDLFEDYELEGGVRVPTTFNGAEYFVVFKDKKNRLDKYYSFYHRSQSNTLDVPPNGALPTQYTPYRTRSATDLGTFEARYPLDIFTSIRGIVTLRNDKFHYYAIDDFSLNSPLENEQRVGLKLEYVFDNTLDVSLNIKNGSRYKFYTEIIKGFDLQLKDELKLEFNKGFMTLVGLDARHYERLGKHSIIAGRIAAATSFGSEKILYYLGGVNNSLFPSFNTTIPIPNSDEFAYQTLATNIRGFKQNIRNGNSFALANVELRVPVFKYLYRRSIRSGFIRNFQVIGFFDVGTAWQGTSPFDDDNPLNTVFVESADAISVQVNYFRDPIVAGYGVGLRTTIFGYFLKVDYARGIETKVIQKPRWHFSMGTDF